MLGSKGLLPPFDTGLLPALRAHSKNLKKKLQDSFRSESRIFFIDGGDLYAERTGYRCSSVMSPRSLPFQLNCNR